MFKRIIEVGNSIEKSTPEFCRVTLALFMGGWLHIVSVHEISREVLIHEQYDECTTLGKYSTHVSRSLEHRSLRVLL